MGEVYINDVWERIGGHTENEIVNDDDGITHYGLSICNIPIGSDYYVKTYLQKKKNRIRQGFDVISKTLHPEIPTRQMQWILTLACLQFQSDYWLRHIDPRLTEQFAKGIDEGIYHISTSGESVWYQNCIFLGHCKRTNATTTSQ